MLPPGASFTNLHDSTYFALPRYRLERLVRDAVLSDTLQALANRSLSAVAVELDRAQNERAAWKLTALAAGALAVVMFALSLLR